MINSLDHIVLTVRNIGKSIDFYCQVLGMKLEKNSLNGREQQSLNFGIQKINLHDENKPFKPHAKKPVPGSMDFCLLSSLPINEWKKKLKKKNINIEIGPVKRQGAAGPLYSIYIRDPDKNLIEISNKKY